MLTYLYGIALAAGFLVLWFVGIRLFIWVSFMLASLFPHIGKRHRHKHWDELNRR